MFFAGPAHLGEHERAALAQHGTWIRRWATLLPRRIYDRQAAAPDEPASPDPATGLALLESASRPYIRLVADTCLNSVDRADGELPGLRVLDLGGGHGAHALEFAHRGCATTVQDLPPVVNIAASDGRLDAAGLDLVAGDAFTHLAPGPFDLVPLERHGGLDGARVLHRLGELGPHLDTRADLLGEIPALQSLANGIERDHAAVLAGLTLS